MWDDANKRAIPTIPGPRTAQNAPLCCGQQMRRDGAQWVCRKCGSFFQPGRCL